MSKQLKPCPHCGDLAWMHDGSVFPNGGRGYRVECEGACHSMTCWWHTEAEAIAAWNRRPAPAQSRDEDAADDALLRGIDGALRAYNELRRDEPFKLTGRECIFADLLSQLRSRLASAQSSAQGEAARKIVAARDEEWKAWIKAKGFDLEPLAGCS